MKYLYFVGICLYFVGISFDVILHRSYFVVDVIYFVVGLPFEVFNIFLQRFHNLGCRQMFVAAIISRLRNCKSFKIQDLYRPPSPPDTGYCLYAGKLFLPVFDSTALVSDTVREFPLR